MIGESREGRRGGMRGVRRFIIRAHSRTYTLPNPGVERKARGREREGRRKESEEQKRDLEKEREREGKGGG